MTLTILKVARLVRARIRGGFLLKILNFKLVAFPATTNTSTMRNLGVVFVLLLCLAIVSPEWVNAAGTGSGGGPARIPMSSLKTLYFRDGGKTLARRGRPMKQLNCIGNSKHLCDTYSPDIIMCKSAGDGAWRVSVLLAILLAT